jgi:hypothetical protein
VIAHLGPDVALQGLDGEALDRCPSALKEGLRRDGRLREGCAVLGMPACVSSQLTRTDDATFRSPYPTWTAGTAPYALGLPGVAEPPSQPRLRSTYGCVRTGMHPGDMPFSPWRSSAWRHADGSPRATGPRQPSPGPAGRGAVSLPAHAIRPMAGRAPGPRADGSAPGDRGCSGPPRGSARHGVSEKRYARPEGGIDPIAGLVAGAPAERIPARRPCFGAAVSLAVAGVRDCPSGRDEASRPRRAQPKVVRLLPCSLWLRTDGDAPWGISESLAPDGASSRLTTAARLA